MKRFVVLAWVAAAILIHATASDALTVRVTSASAALGAPAPVDVFVDDVDITRGVGSYDITLGFDPAIVSFDSASAGAALGFGTGLLATPGVNSVGLAEVSFESPFDLLALQAPSFRLHTLLFRAIAAGTSTISVDSLLFFDAFGAPLLAAAVADGAITVVAISEPDSLMLMSGGLLTLLTSIAFKLYRVRRS